MNELLLTVAPVAEATVRVLLHSLWQGTAIAVAAVMINGALRRARPELRYAVGCLALAAMLVVPILTVVVPSGPPVLVAEPLVGASDVALASPQSSELAAPVATVPSSPAVPAPVWIVALWLTGVLLVSMTHVVGLIRLRRLSAAGEMAGDAIFETARRLSRRIGVDRAVRVVISRTIDGPMVVGWLRPVVLLPCSALTGLPTEQLEAVLAHELAHVRRHDWLVNLLQVAVETVVFYHPGVWWVSRAVRAERELCCDDLAVRACGGDRVGYARSLAALEHHRSLVPQTGLAASGGSLLGRIQRLLGVQPRARWTGGWWIGAVIVPVVVAVIVAGSAGSSNAAPSTQLQPASALPASSGVAASSEATAQAGTWHTDGRGQLTIRLGDLDRIWLNLVGDSDRLIRADGGFELRRDAGTLRFSGDPTAPGGSGEVVFAADARFVSNLEASAIEASERQLVEMALHGLEYDLVTVLRELEYTDATARRLIELAIHGATVDWVRAMAEAGYSPLDAEQLAERLGAVVSPMPPGSVDCRSLIEFRIHGVDPEYVQRMAATGYGSLSGRTLVEFRIHGVDPELVRELERAGLGGTSPRQLLELAIHGVGPEYVQEMAAAGYGGLDARTLVEFRIHGVDPEYVREMAATGYGGLDARTLIEFKIHGVEAESVRLMAGAGYAGLDKRTLLELRIHGVDPEYVRDMAAVGLGGVSARQLIEFKIHGVTPEYVENMSAAGFPIDDPRQLIEFRIHGVDPDLVAELKAAGISGLDARRILEFAIHGVSPAFVRQMAETGLTVRDARTLIEFRIHGVTPAYVRELTEIGLADLDPDDLVRLRVHGISTDTVRRRHRQGLTLEEIIDLRIAGH